MKNNFLLTATKTFNVILIICFSIEMIILFFAVMHNVSNPGTKGVSSKDFSQLGTLILVTTILLILVYYAKKNLKSDRKINN